MEPYRLALREDDPRERDNLTNLCRAFLDAQGIPGTLEVFPNTVELEEALEEAPGRYDLLLLDIQMWPWSGPSIGKKRPARPLVGVGRSFFVLVSGRRQAGTGPSAR